MRMQLDDFLADPETESLLKLRSGNLNTYIDNYAYNYDFYGLQKFAPKGEVPTLPES
jgi:hypothetical protein